MTKITRDTVYYVNDDQEWFLYVISKALPFLEIDELILKEGMWYVPVKFSGIRELSDGVQLSQPPRKFNISISDILTKSILSKELNSVFTDAYGKPVKLIYTWKRPDVNS